MQVDNKKNDKLGKLIDYLIAAFPKEKLPPETAFIFYRALQQLNFDDLFDAVNNYIKEEEFFPRSAATLIKKVEEKKRGQQRQADKLKEEQLKNCLLCDDEGWRYLKPVEKGQRGAVRRCTHDPNTEAKFLALPHSTKRLQGQEEDRRADIVKVLWRAAAKLRRMP